MKCSFKKFSGDNVVLIASNLWLIYQDRAYLEISSDLYEEVWNHLQENPIDYNSKAHSLVSNLLSMNYQVCKFKVGILGFSLLLFVLSVEEYGLRENVTMSQ